MTKHELHYIMEALVNDKVPKLNKMVTNFFLNMWSIMGIKY